MGVFKKKWIQKAITKCKSMNHGRPGGSPRRRLSKSRSWPSDPEATTPQGCFAVYVGQGRQRFAVSAKQSGHPLFRALLEDAETEYGHSSRGPLRLPCDVDTFCEVLAHIDGDPTDDVGCGMLIRSPGARARGYTPLRPSNMLNL